jgi:DNA-binding transcriptional ArsR family regulator
MAEYQVLQFPAQAVVVDPEVAAALPPSCHRIIAVLSEGNALTHDELARATGLPSRTIRFALRRLRDAGLVESMRSLRDCRTCYIYLSRQHVDPTFLELARQHADWSLQAAHGDLLPTQATP